MRLKRARARDTTSSLLAVAEGLRIDGRRDVDARNLVVSFVDNGNCEVQLGRTRLHSLFIDVDRSSVAIVLTRAPDHQSAVHHYR